MKSFATFKDSANTARDRDAINTVKLEGHKKGRIEGKMEGRVEVVIYGIKAEFSNEIISTI